MQMTSLTAQAQATNQATVPILRSYSPRIQPQATKSDWESPDSEPGIQVTQDQDPLVRTKCPASVCHHCHATVLHKSSHLWYWSTPSVQERSQF